MNTTHSKAALRAVLSLVTVALVATGCGGSDDDNGITQPDDTGADVAADVESDATADAGEDGGDDTGEDGGTDTGADAESDAEADTGVDAGETDIILGGPCETHDDCADEGEGSYCYENVCTTWRCPDPGFWDLCEENLNQIGEDFGRFAICRRNTCLAACMTDQDCGDGEVCTDFGECHPFTGEITGQHPGAGGDGLRAGVANVLWTYPVGMPLGGYGQRAAVNDGRYAESLRASAGQTHGLFIRALVIDTGDRMHMTIRLPAIFTDMSLHEDVARALQERTGDDWRDSLIISSTHTHSGPARHWQLPPAAAASLGSFGIGEFSQWAYIWMRDSVIEAALAALDDLSPARIGWEVIEAFDMDDAVGRDRWEQTPPFDDNRVLLVRVDDPEGTPRAFMFSFAAHGTDNESDYVSGDALGGVERWLEMELGERYDTFVPTMFINQNSGGISPGGGVQGHRFPQTTERIGWAFAQKVMDAFEEMEMRDELQIRAVSHRFPITYDLLGYARGDFAGPGGRPFGGEYHYGGLSCVGQYGGDRDYHTHQEIDGMTCAGALMFLLFNQPPTIMARSQIHAMEWTSGDDSIAFLTAPGELATALGWQFARALRDDFDIDPLDVWTYGYANDHLLYILPTNLRGERPPYPGLSTPHPDDMTYDADGYPNTPGAPDDYPDFAFSYLQGGYESTMSPWGPLLGDYLVQQARDAWAKLEDPDADVQAPPTYPTQFTIRDDVAYEIRPTPADLVGTIVQDVPETVERLTPIEFVWVGGDPGAEMPQVPLVTLQRDIDGEWTDVVLPNTRTYTNLEQRFLTRVREREDTHFEWIVRWEELHDFPLGDYRFVVEGHRHDDMTDRVPYSLTSGTFSLVGTPIEFDVAPTEAGVTVTMGYAAEERMEFLESRNDRGAVSGDFRMRDPMVPQGVRRALYDVGDVDDGSFTVRLEQGDDVLGVSPEDISYVFSRVDAAGRRNVPNSRLDVTLPDRGPGEWDLVVIVEDLHGNVGELRTPVPTLP